MAGATKYPAALDDTDNQPTAATLSGIQLDGDGTANNIHSNVRNKSRRRKMNQFCKRQKII